MTPNILPDDYLLRLTLNYKYDLGLMVIGPYLNNDEGREKMRKHLIDTCKEDTRFTVQKEFYEFLHQAEPHWIDVLQKHVEDGQGDWPVKHEGDKVFFSLGLKKELNQTVAISIKMLSEGDTMKVWRVLIGRVPDKPYHGPLEKRLMKQVLNENRKEKGMKYRPDRMDRIVTFPDRRDAIAWAEGFIAGWTGSRRADATYQISEEMFPNSGEKWGRAVVWNRSRWHLVSVTSCVVWA